MSSTFLSSYVEDCRNLLRELNSIRLFSLEYKLTCSGDINKSYFQFDRRLNSLKTDGQGRKLEEALKRELDFWENHPQIKAEKWRIRGGK